MQSVRFLFFEVSCESSFAAVDLVVFVAVGRFVCRAFHHMLVCFTVARDKRGKGKKKSAAFAASTHMCHSYWMSTLHCRLLQTGLGRKRQMLLHFHL